MLRFTLVYPLAHSQNTILAPGNCFYEHVKHQSRHIAGGPLLASLLCSTDPRVIRWLTQHCCLGCRLVQHHYFQHTFRPSLKASFMDGITESRQKPRVIDGDCRQQPCSIKGVAAQGLHSSHLHGRGTVQGAELAPPEAFLPCVSPKAMLPR